MWQEAAGRTDLVGRRPSAQPPMRRVLVCCLALGVCCTTVAAADPVAGVEDEDGVEIEQRKAAQARRGQAIRDLQAHAKEGYRPGADIMEGARSGGALGLSQYVQALVGWDDETWAAIKRIGLYGCVRCDPSAHRPSL